MPPYSNSLRTIYQKFPNPYDHPWNHTRGCKFLSSRSWGTRSKAFEKSIIIASSLVASFVESDMSWQTVVIWLSHEYPGLKPCWPSYNQSLSSHSCLIEPAITCYICLHSTEVKLTGLKFITTERSPPLWIRTTMAFFQSLGIVPLLIVMSKNAPGTQSWFPHPF